MDERIIKFRVGVMVVSTVFIGGLLVLLFGDTGSIVRGHYTIHIHFSDAPGVTEGTPVRKSGILIGRVTKVDFADQGGVNVTAEIRNDVKLYRSEVPQVTGSLLGGDVVIQFMRRCARPPAVRASARERRTADPPARHSRLPRPKAPAAQGEVLIGEGDYLEGVVAPSPVQVITNLEGNLATAVDSLSNAGDEVAKVATSINRLLAGNEDKIDHIIDGMEATLGSFQKALANIDDVIGNPEVRENLREAIKEMPQLLSDTRSTMNTMKTTVESVDRNLRNLEGFTGPLGDRGEQIVSRADQADCPVGYDARGILRLRPQAQQRRRLAGQDHARSDLVSEPGQGHAQHRAIDVRVASDRGRRPGVRRQDRPPSRVAGRPRRDPEEPRHEVAWLESAVRLRRGSDEGQSLGHASSATSVQSADLFAPTYRLNGCVGLVTAGGDAGRPGRACGSGKGAVGGGGSGDCGTPAP